VAFGKVAAGFLHNPSHSVCVSLSLPLSLSLYLPRDQSALKDEQLFPVDLSSLVADQHSERKQ